MGKKLIAVSETFTINQPDDPMSAITAYTDLSLLLSKYYGKNIRQGNTFNLSGYTAQLSQDSATDDADTGMAVQGLSQYVPTTKHSRAAWNHQFKRWRRQKQLSGNVGQLVRNDDFEHAFEAQGITSRTSTVFATGMGDTNSESVCLTGTSSTGVDSSLADLYNSLNPQEADSRTEFGTTVKDPKYTYKFPEIQGFTWTAHASSNADWTQYVEVLGVGDATAGSVHYMGASNHQDFIAFPQDGCLPIMCGLLKHIIYVLPPDVDTGPDPPTSEDDWTLTITYYIESWTPLVYRAKRAMKKAMSRSYKKGYRRGKTYGRKRRYRRRR